MLSKEEKERRKQERTLKKYNETHKSINGVIYKLCSYEEHWVEMNDENFNKNKSNGIDGFHPYCKECNRKKTLIWTEENFDKKKEYMDKYWENLKGDRRKRYNIKIKLMTRRYRQDGGRKDWENKNRDKLKQYGQNREQNKKHKISKKEWLACLDYFNNQCAYCGISNEDAKKTYNNYLHKEHVNHQGSNDLSNCIPTCKQCNSEKHTFGLEEWYDKSNIKFTQKRLNKIHKWLNEDYKLYIKVDII